MKYTADMLRCLLSTLPIAPLVVADVILDMFRSDDVMTSPNAVTYLPKAELDSTHCPALSLLKLNGQLHDENPGTRSK
ncbi:hypothetical protein V8C26DRAFT_413679 [Trichoderma gracile]